MCSVLFVFVICFVSFVVRYYLHAIRYYLHASLAPMQRALVLSLSAHRKVSRAVQLGILRL